MKFRPCYFVFLFCLAASCTDENVFFHQEKEPDNTVVNIFSATYEYNGSRTVIDDLSGHLTWNDGDEISVFSSSEIPTRFVTHSTGDTATFIGEIASSSKFWALYPYSSDSKFIISSSSLNTYLSVNQDALDGTFDPKCFLAVGVSSKQLFDFKNVCGGIRFTVSRNGIKRVVFKSNDPSTYLAGNVSISISSDGIPSSVVDDNESDSIVLTCPDGFVTGKHYYITSIPCKLPSGFKMSFYASVEPAGLISTTICSEPLEIKRSVYSTISEADLQSQISKIKSTFDLSELESANCYIVNHAGNYKFRAVQGNNSTPIEYIDKVKIEWETANTSEQIQENSIISKVSYNQNYIYFSTPDVLKNGNALIAAYNGDIVVWSWHIWCCDSYDPNATARQYEYFGKSAFLGDKYMMDRNLGALSASESSALSNGLMYQWGRKDPFMGGADRKLSSTAKMYSTHPAQVVDNATYSINLNYSVRNPNTFICATKDDQGNWLDRTNNNLWAPSSKSKSQYDPCPPGWRVPDGGYYEKFDQNRNPWKISENKYELEQFEINSNGYLGAYINLAVPQGQSVAKTFYPCNGYLSAKTSELIMNGELTYYWSATPYNTSPFVYTFIINIDTAHGDIQANSAQIGSIRGEGHSVRCISID